MYAINVFVGFTLSNIGMTRFWIQHRAEHPSWWRKIVIHVIGALLCAGILVVTIFEKFRQGAWLTLVITGAAIAVCWRCAATIAAWRARLVELNREFEDLPSVDHAGGEPDPREPTAVLLVGSFGGLGIHSMLAIHKMVPSYFKNIVFVSVAVVDSGSFKGAAEIARAAGERRRRACASTSTLARRLGWNAGSATGVGIDPADEITRVCIELAEQYPARHVLRGQAHVAARDVDAAHPAQRDGVSGRAPPAVEGAADDGHPATGEGEAGRVSRG